MNIQPRNDWLTVGVDSPQNDGDEEDCSVLCESSPGREETVESVEEHGDHDNVHGVPVGVPLDLYHPLPEIKIEPGEEVIPSLYFVILRSSHLIQIQTLKLARATSSMITLVMKRMYWRLSSLFEAVSKSEFLTEL